MTEKIVNAAALKALLKTGAANGQNVCELSFLLGSTERAVRTLVDELIEAGTPVCAHPKHGYFLAATSEEVEGVCEFLRNRAMHSLNKVKQLRQAFYGAASNELPFHAEELPT